MKINGMLAKRDKTCGHKENSNLSNIYVWLLLKSTLDNIYQTN